MRVNVVEGKNPYWLNLEINSFSDKEHIHVIDIKFQKVGFINIKYYAYILYEFKKED